MLNSQDFIKILVAEMRNQDPTNPTDPLSFVNESVAFSSLNALENIENALSKTPDLGQASSEFLNRKIAANGNLVGITGGQSTAIRFLAPAPGQYTAEIFDANGSMIAQASIDVQSGNTFQNFNWNPGTSVKDGIYRVQVIDSSGQQINGLEEQGIVKGVQILGGQIMLDIGNILVPESEVIEIDSAA